MVAARSGDCIHMSKANRLRVSRRLSALAKDLRQNSQAGKDASVAAPQTRPRSTSEIHIHSFSLLHTTLQ